VPDDLSLLGCVFYITDYQKLVDIHQFDAWVKVIKDNGGQVDDSYSNRITHLLCQHQCSDVFRLVRCVFLHSLFKFIVLQFICQALRDGKRLVTAYWLNDVLVKHKLSPPWMAVHFPLVFGKSVPEKVKEEVSLNCFHTAVESRHLQSIFSFSVSQTLKGKSVIE
jgi:PAX-interacting protein 1